MSRAARLITVIGLLCGLLLVWWYLTTPPAFRHVVLVSLDTTRADSLGPWGHPDAHTRTIDQLAAESLLFERHYSAAPTTLSSHTSMMTGRYPHHHGVPRNDYEVDEANLFLAEILRDAGWTTAAFLGAIPLASYSGFPQGFDEVDEKFTRDRRSDAVAQSERPGVDVTESTLTWLDQRRRAKEERLFLFVHYFDAHAPYTADFDVLRRMGIVDPPRNAGTLLNIARTVWLLNKGDSRGRRNAETLKQMYQAGVVTADEALGGLIDGLRERGILDEALVIITADHGEAFDAHREKFDHGEDVYDETIHTPLLLRFPGGWSGGWRTPEVVSAVDLLPTLLDLLKLPSVDTDGRSLYPLLTGALTGMAPSPAFAEATKPHVVEQPGWQNTLMRKAVVRPDGKVIYDPRTEVAEQFDPITDPLESSDLFEPDSPLSRDLLNTLYRWMEQADPLPSSRTSSARMRAELAALGYTEGVEPDAGAQPEEGELP